MTLREDSLSSVFRNKKFYKIFASFFVSYLIMLTYTKPISQFKSYFELLTFHQLAHLNFLTNNFHNPLFYLVEFASCRFSISGILHIRCVFTIYICDPPPTSFAPSVMRSSSFNHQGNFRTLT